MALAGTQKMEGRRQEASYDEGEVGLHPPPVNREGLRGQAC